MDTKHILLLSVKFFLVWTGFQVSAQVDTVSIDLGGPETASPAPWNNLTNENTGSLENCLDQNGYHTGIAVSVTDAFNGTNFKGLSAHDSLNIADEAAGDSFFGSAVEAIGGHEITGGITLYNLDVTTKYSFEIFGSREAGDNRETKYVVEGAGKDSAYLDVAGNSDHMARINDIYPQNDGSITITATTGPNNTNASGYYYMGAIKMMFVNPNPPGSKELALTYPNGNEFWEAGKEPKIKWKSTNVLNVGIEYSTDAGTTWDAVVSSAPALSGEYAWSVPSAVSDHCLVRIFDVSETTVADTSDHVFKIAEAGSENYRIVVLGSSTAAGNGPSTPDSAWVWRYDEFLTQNDTRFEVINLAKGGFTTYDILPTGTPISGVSETIDLSRNITKALEYNPNAVIINLPSNDAARGYPVEDQLKNYELIAQTATEGKAFLWVTTPQPRDFSESSKLQALGDMVDSTYAVFGDFAIDFWTGFHETNGSLKNEYDSGDGIHVNDSAHKILFERVAGKNIATYIMNHSFPTSVVGLEGEKIRGLEVYPNPTRTFLNVKLAGKTKGELVKLKIYSLSGTLVAEHSILGSESMQLDVSELPAGMWLLQAGVTGLQATAPFIKK